MLLSEVFIWGESRPTGEDEQWEGAAQKRYHRLKKQAHGGYRHDIPVVNDFPPGYFQFTIHFPEGIPPLAGVSEVGIVMTTVGHHEVVVSLIAVSDFEHLYIGNKTAGTWGRVVGPGVDLKGAIGANGERKDVFDPS